MAPTPSRPLPPPDAPRAQSRAVRVVRGATALLGVGVICYGIWGLLHDHYIRDPLDVLVWGLRGVILHDGFWLPLVLLAGTALTRSPLLRGGLVVAAALTAVGLPAVLREGTDHGNASLLPLPYLRNWLLLLATVAVVVALIALAPHVPGALRATGLRLHRTWERWSAAARTRRRRGLGE